MPEDIRKECILAIKSKRNNTFHNNQQGNTQQNNYSVYQGSSSGQTSNQNKGQKKKNKIQTTHPTNQSHVGSATKKVTRKLNVVQEYDKTNL
jgi:hypothetical protein